MRELISIHIGQTGVHIGDNCWDLYCTEHGILPNGQLTSDTHTHTSDTSTDDSLNTRFSETSTGKYIPRAVFVDLEPTEVNKTRLRWSGGLFNSEQLISGSQDASNNYARGFYTVGKEIIDRTVDQLRKLTESCTNPQGCIIFHSLGGGTGSGFSSLLLDRLSEDYSTKSRIEFAVLPSSTLSTAVVEPYNAVLATHATMNHSNLTILVDNSALSRICSRELELAEPPRYPVLNSLLAEVISPITKPHEIWSVNPDSSSLGWFHENLVIYPRIHFAVCSYAPVIPNERMEWYDYSVKGISKRAYQPENVMLECKMAEGKLMGYVGLYHISNSWNRSDITNAIVERRTDQQIQFVDWTRGSWFAVDERPTVYTREGDFGKSPTSLCVLSSTTAISNAWNRVDREFDSLYTRRAYVHWYVAEGMEETLFSEAREDLEQIEKEYAEMGEETELGEETEEEDGQE
jgi:tubulin alpha